MSLGISAVINGTVQTLSTGGMRESNMLIFENIAPGETIEREITFDPVISSEDKGKKQLPITFSLTSTPHIYPMKATPPLV